MRSQINDKFPVDRLSGETTLAYRAFMIYCLLGDGKGKRSVNKAYNVHMGRDINSTESQASRQWKTWSVQHRWAQRVVAYDEAIVQLEFTLKKEAYQKQVKKCADWFERLFEKAAIGCDQYQDIVNAKIQSAKDDLEEGEMIKSMELKAIGDANSKNISSMKDLQEMWTSLLHLDEVSAFLREQMGGKDSFLTFEEDD